MSVGWALFLTATFLAVNAFFVAAEFAVTGSRRAQIEPLLTEKKRGAAQAMYALEHVSLMLATCQLGITVMSTSLGVIAEPALASLIGAPLTALGAGPAVVHGVAFVGALIIVLYLHVVFGEMVPKNLSLAVPQRAILWLAPPLVAIAKAIGPAVHLMDHTANWFLRRFGMEPSKEISATFTVEEVANIVQVSEAEGMLNDELGLISGTLEFSTENAGQVMVPMGDLLILPWDFTPADVEKAVAHTGYSRFPVSGPDGTVTGYIHLKDVLYADEQTRTEPVPDWKVRPFKKLRADEEIEDALRIMQKTGTHMLGVRAPDTGPHAPMLGVLFLEDILERLVGEVRDGLQRTMGPPPQAQ